MNYFSTRDQSLNLSFEEIFFKGLSSDGVYFYQNNFHYFLKMNLKNLKILASRR